MSCAACDNCPRDTWHLHVTVASKILTPADEAHFRDKYGIKFVRVHNMVQDQPGYPELIPTMHVKCSEAVAIRRLMDMHHVLLSHGFGILRHKIEGNASTIVGRDRVLYYESHLKNLLPEAEARAKNLRVPLSINARGERIYTIRHPAVGHVYELAWSLSRAEEDHTRTPRIEACVLDTAPELDDSWMKGSAHV